jgi:3-phenylpropionate/cinnamic acid dioxygenase small subunit
MMASVTTGEYMASIGGVAGIDRRGFEDFIVHEARLLDARRFRDWMALFADDGTYWVPAVPDQQRPFDQASLFYVDRGLMKMRIDQLDHPRIHLQMPPSCTVHLVGNIAVEAADGAKGEFVVGSTVIMVEYRRTGSACSRADSGTSCAARATASASCRSAST